MIMTITIDTDLTKSELDYILEYNSVVHRIQKANNLCRSLSEKEQKVYEQLVDRFNTLSQEVKNTNLKINKIFRIDKGDD